MENSSIDRDRLKYVCKVRSDQKHINFNLTYIAERLYYSDVTSLRRQLRKGEIKTDYLDKIARLLDVSPDYLSGKVDLLKNGEIPTYTTYLFWDGFDKWSQKHTLYDLTIALLKLQGADPGKYTRYQIVSLSLRLVGLVNDFIAAGNMFLQDDIGKEGKENG